MHFTLVARALPRASFVSPRRNLDKDHVRQCLMRQENVIIYNWLERSEFCFNPETYNSECCKILGFSGTLLEYIMQETEKSHAKAGKYKYQGEIPFFGEILFEPTLPRLEYLEGLDHGVLGINLNEVIWACYLNKILPELVKDGSEGNSGLTAVCDMKILQALSERVHYSMFLAEAKFGESPDMYEQAIVDQDIEKLRKIVKAAEIDEIKHRAENRMTTFGLPDSPLKLKLELACELFDKYIIPLTVEAQVQYLILKGLDADASSREVRKLIRLKALSKSTQFLVKAAPSLVLFAKISVFVVFAVVFTLRKKIIEYLSGRGFVPDTATLAVWAVYLLSVKGTYDALKKVKEVVELARYYVKLLEKDKKKA